MTTQTTNILILFIFFITYAFIVSEKIHRTIISLISASILMLFHFMSQKEAIDFIDFNTISLLIGMMTIVLITQQSGVFTYLAMKLVKITKGNSLYIFLSFTILTAIFSAFLDNVTTILFIIPITFIIIDILKIPAYPLIMSEIIASNIGGTATLIGDPPNLLIGNSVHISFNEFLKTLAPVVIFTMGIMIMFFMIIYKKRLPKKDVEEKIRSFDENSAIKNWTMAYLSSIVTILTLIGFIFGEHFGYQPSLFAMTGAFILILLSRRDPLKYLRKIEWNTILFLCSLFIIVGSLEKIGLMEYLADKITHLTHNRLYLCIIILWVSGIVSSFLDNIPFVLTMIPVIQSLAGPEHLHLTRPESMPLWWSLSLGACFGGNGTLIGASANIVAVGMAEQFRPGLITFKTFMKVGIPLMLISLTISTFFIWIKFF